MTNNNEHQAAKLKELFEKVTNHEADDTRADEIENVKTEGDYIELDVLKLPPRSEVHQTAKKKMSFRFKTPFTRLIIVIVLLLTVLFVIYYIVGDQITLFFR